MTYVQLGTADSRAEFTRRFKLAAKGSHLNLDLACVRYTEMKIYCEKFRLYNLLVVAASTYSTTVETLAE